MANSQQFGPIRAKSIFFGQTKNNAGDTWHPITDCN